jgi:site-specific DNA recombinase
VKIRKDVASGKSDDREGFQELLAHVRAGKIDVVLVYRLDRLSRNVRDIYDLLDLLQQHGVAFVSVTEGFDTTTAMGRAMLGVAAVFAQLTRDMIAENTRDGLLRRAEAGLYNGNKNNVTGYHYSREQGLIVNPEEAQTIRQIFAWFTEHKWGIQKIARLLNLRGIPSKTGRQWSKGRIAWILRNCLYCGDVRANGEVILGRHEAIVSREQFVAAQDLIQSRTFLPPRSHQSQHLLAGIARCGVCGQRLAAHHIQSTHNGKKHKYILYHHGRSVKVGEVDCPGVSKSAQRLEAALLEKIQEVATSGRIEQLILADVQSRESGKRAPMIVERDQLLLERAELGEKFSQWADRLDAGKIDEEQFECQNQRLRRR